MKITASLILGFLLLVGDVRAESPIEPSVLAKRLKIFNNAGPMQAARWFEIVGKNFFCDVVAQRDLYEQNSLERGQADILVTTLHDNIVQLSEIIEGKKTVTKVTLASVGDDLSTFNKKSNARVIYRVRKNMLLVRHDALLDGRWESFAVGFCISK